MAKKKPAAVAYEVLVDFECKLTGQYFRVGSAYVGDADRIKYLTDAGYLGDEAETSTPNDLQKEEVDDNGSTGDDKKGAEDK